MRYSFLDVCTRLIGDFGTGRKGELTLGMCVVDRRGGAPASERGKSRAELQELADKKAVNGAVQAANVQVDKPEQAEIEQSKGVHIIVKTPGIDELARTLFRKVWGADDA